MREQRPGFGDLLATLDKESVRYMLIGGYAMAAYGADYGCQDLDLYYERSETNIVALVSALTPFQPRLRGAPSGLPFAWDLRTLKAAPYLPLATDSGDVDLLGRVAGVDTFDGVWERAAVIQVAGVPVRVPCLEDLITMKRSKGREWDQLALEILFALQRLNEQRQSAV